MLEKGIYDIRIQVFYGVNIILKKYHYHDMTYK